MAREIRLIVQTQGKPAILTGITGLNDKEQSVMTPPGKQKEHPSF